MSKHLFRVLLALALLGGTGAMPSVADQILCDSNRDAQDRGQKVCRESCDAAYKNDAKKKDGCNASCAKTWLYCVDKIKADEQKAAAKSIACHEPSSNASPNAGKRRTWSRARSRASATTPR